MGRDAFLAPLKLRLMKKSQSRRQKSNDRRSLVDLRRECRGRPRLVVVFQEAGELVLIVDFCAEMLAYRTRMTFAQSIVEPFIVGVVEPLLLQRPFSIPVDLGHETEVRMLLAHGLGCLGPKEFDACAPSPFEHVGQDQHRHVAPHAVALPGNSL